MLLISNSQYGLEACKHNGNALAELFTSFQFRLFQDQVHQNVTASQAMDLCEQLAAEDHTEAGACIIYFTGCGTHAGVFEGVDGGKLEISKLTAAFEASGESTTRQC